MIKLFYCGGFTRFEGSVYAIKTIMIFIPTPSTPIYIGLLLLVFLSTLMLTHSTGGRSYVDNSFCVEPFHT